MKSYLDIVREVVENGVDKQPVRVDSHVKNKDGSATVVENGAIGVPCVPFEHYFRDGFPLLTTKRVSLRTVAVELEGFIKGVTHKQWYKDRGCNIWNAWCNPSMIPDKIKGDKEAVKEFMVKQNDLGCIYGSQWRNFAGTGYDQFKIIADRLRENPYDRRMVCSAWAPHLMHKMALPPCHLVFNVIVYGDTISLWWGQRSCDLMLGVPFNIASYGLLLCLLAQHSGLRPYKLMGTLGDCHIYKNQIDAAKEQLGRTPLQLPSLTLPDELDDETFDIFNWTHNDLVLDGYENQGVLDFGEVTVT